MIYKLFCYGYYYTHFMLGIDIYCTITFPPGSSLATALKSGQTVNKMAIQSLSESVVHIIEAIKQLGEVIDKSLKNNGRLVTELNATQAPILVNNEVNEADDPKTKNPSESVNVNNSIPTLTALLRDHRMRICPLLNIWSRARSYVEEDIA